MTCFIAKDINKEFIKSNDSDMMLLVSDKETKLEQLEEIIDLKKQVFDGSEEYCYHIDRHSEFAANMLNKRPFVFNIVVGYELNKIRNHGITENQELLDRLKGYKTKSKLYYIKIDADNRLGNILFSDADNREDAIKDLYYAAKNILKWGHDFPLSLENRQFPYLQLGDPTITSNFNSRQYFERLNVAGVTQCPDIEIFNKAKIDQAKVESIGEENKDSNANCSRCGRANTWHPDCPTCKRIDDLEQFIVKLSYFALCVEGKSKRTDEIVIRNTLEALNITEDDLINQHARLYTRMINIIVGKG